MNPLQGISAIQTLDMLVQQQPKLQKLVSALLSKGRSPEEIIDYLQQPVDQTTSGARYATPYGMTETDRSEAIRQSSSKGKQDALMQALKLGTASLAGGLGLRYAMSKAPQLAQRAIGALGSGKPPPSTPPPTGTPPPSPQAPPSPQGAVMDPQDSFYAQAIQKAPKGAIKNIVKGVASAFGFKNKALVNAVADIVEATGKDITEIAEEAKAVGDLSTPDKAKEAVDELKKQYIKLDVEELTPYRVDEAKYIANQISRIQRSDMPEDKKQAMLKKLRTKASNLLTGKLSDQEKEAERFQDYYGKNPREDSFYSGTKGALMGGTPIATRGGKLGKLVEEKDGIATIETEDGLRRKKVDDIIKPSPDIAEGRYEIDYSGIPESEKSAVLREFMITPDRRQAAIRFHSGENYMYFRKDGQPIDDSIIDRLAVGQNKPRTSGITFYGSWDPEMEDSRGNEFYESLKSQAEAYDEENPDGQDPNKPYFFVKMEKKYEHPYQKRQMEEESKAKAAWKEKRKKKKRKS